ncbi:PadR family transcriptional regulator [Fodinicola acaciae]|uniref:PadR family transcriptional regulator n=1 Tax=Fodinicola acaciae TaxID=2681555 RepID=UPI0013D42753|nr:PadR family transcriptional regulator [Fodinicola acaciae]
MSREDKRSALGLTVLGALAEEPMHAYRIQEVIKERGKDRVVNIRQRASIYQTIERLLRLGLIAVHSTARVENRPERTVYQLTPAGRATAVTWVKEMLSTTGGDFPEFPVGLSFIMALAPEDAAAQLEIRAKALASELAGTDTVLHEAADVPRLFLLEEEYRRIVLKAELSWLRSVVADLHAGRLTWTEEWIRQLAVEYNKKQKEKRREQN